MAGMTSLDPGGGVVAPAGRGGLSRRGVGWLWEREHAASAGAQLANPVPDGDAHRRAEAFGLGEHGQLVAVDRDPDRGPAELHGKRETIEPVDQPWLEVQHAVADAAAEDRKSTRLNSS